MGVATTTFQGETEACRDKISFVTIGAVGLVSLPNLSVTTGSAGWAVSRPSGRPACTTARNNAPIDNAL